MLVNFMALRKRDRWTVREERVLKNHRDLPLIGQASQWPTARGWCMAL